MREIDAREYAGWVAYYNAQPWGNDRDDLRAGVIASFIANSNPYRKRSAKAIQPEDVFPNLAPKGKPRGHRRKAYGKDMITAAMLWTVALGGEIIRPGEKS